MADEPDARRRIKTLHDEIEYWRGEARRRKSDAWLIAIGVAYGLTIARDDYVQAPKEAAP